MSDRKKDLAVHIGTERGANVRVQKAKKRLVQMGAPPRLVRKAQPTWEGNENQVMATYHTTAGREEEAEPYKRAQALAMKKRKKK